MKLHLLVSVGIMHTFDTRLQLLRGDGRAERVSLSRHGVVFSVCCHLWLKRVSLSAFFLVFFRHCRTEFRVYAQVFTLKLNHTHIHTHRNTNRIMIIDCSGGNRLTLISPRFRFSVGGHCGAAMLGVIKNLRVVRGLVRKHNNYGSVPMLTLPAARLRGS